MDFDMTEEEFTKACNRSVEKLFRALNKNRADVIISSLSVVMARFCVDVAKNDKEKAINLARIYFNMIEEFINSDEEIFGSVKTEFDFMSKP